MQKFVSLAFVLVLCFGAELLAEKPANVQAIISNESSGAQLTLSERQHLRDYLTVQNPLQFPETDEIDPDWGPDGWGYTADQTTLTWYDINTDLGGTEFWEGADYTDQWLLDIPLPFTFPFYGTNYNYIDINSNILISFNHAYPAYNQHIPGPYLRIDPWVYDMYHLGSASHFYYKAFSDTMFVVSFVDARYNDTNYRNNPDYGKTMQVLLWPDGRIKFQYLSVGLVVENTPYYSGIDDAGDYGLTVGRTFTDSLAITFCPPDTGINLAWPTVYPQVGSTTDDYYYSIFYRNTFGFAPTVKNVYIDGTPYAMTDPGGNYTIGVTMTYGPVTLSAGSHDYYFYFDDGTYTVRLPESGTYPEPMVYAPLSGSYDVGGGANDFPDPVTMADILQIAGMSGPVISNIYSGTYDGQINLPAIQGNSAVNTLTFQPGPGQSPWITSTDGHGFNLTGADYVTIQDLTIARCDRCGIYNYHTGTDSSTHNRYLRNYIINAGTHGGNYDAGIYLYRAADCKVIGNEFGWNRYGIYPHFSDRLTITGNLIFNTVLVGLYARVTNNSLYANNMVSSSGSTGIIADLNIGTDNGFYYNSVYAGEAMAFHKDEGHNTRVFNNIFFYDGTSGSEYAYYLDGDTGTYSITSDYNDLYAPNANVGWYNTHPLQTLADWRAATGLDLNSISDDPLYASITSPIDLHITDSSSVLDAGTPIAGIIDDFDGDIRDAVAPDIGADERIDSTLYSIEDLVVTLSGSSNDSLDVTLYWSTVQFAAQYHIYKSITGPGGVYTLIGSTTNTTYTDNIAVAQADISCYYVTADDESSDAPTSRIPGQHLRSTAAIRER